LSCEVCEKDIWYCEITDSWYLRIEESEWNHSIDGFNYQDIGINFCPECGKDYRKLKRCELCTCDIAITTVEHKRVIWQVCEECKRWADSKRRGMIED